MGPKIKRWSAAKKAEIVLALLRRTKQLVDICRENALKGSCRKAYIEISKSVHPDRLPEMWKKEGEELFKVIKAANEYTQLS